MRQPTTHPSQLGNAINATAVSMPRKEHNINLGQRIAALQHAEASHGKEKAVFGGRRLVLPGMGGREARPAHVSTTPLLEAHEQTRPSSSWAPWSKLDVSHNNENANTMGQTLASKPRQHPSEGRSDALIKRHGAEEGHEIPNTESATSSQLYNFMNNLLVEQNSSETTNDSVLRENRSPRSAAPAPDSEPHSERANQQSYYNQRSARGRLGIDERIDVFEPQISSNQTFKNFENVHPRRIRAADEDATLATYESSVVGKQAQPAHVGEPRIPTMSAWRTRLVPFRRSKSETSVSVMPVGDDGSHSSQCSDCTMAKHSTPRVQKHERTPHTTDFLHSPRPNAHHRSTFGSWSASSLNRSSNDALQVKRSQVDTLFPIPNESHRQLQAQLFEAQPSRVARPYTSTRKTHGFSNSVDDHTIHTLSTPKIANAASNERKSQTRQRTRHFDGIELPGISKDLSSSVSTRIRWEPPQTTTNPPTDTTQLQSPKAKPIEGRSRVHEPIKPPFKSPRAERPAPPKVRHNGETSPQREHGIRHPATMSWDGDFIENLKHEAFAEFDDEVEIENPFEWREPTTKGRTSIHQRGNGSFPSLQPDTREPAPGQGHSTSITQESMTHSKQTPVARINESAREPVGKPSNRRERLTSEELEFHVGYIHTRERSSSPVKTKSRKPKENANAAPNGQAGQAAVDTEPHKRAQVRNGTRDDRNGDNISVERLVASNSSQCNSARYSRGAELSNFHLDDTALRNPFRDIEQRGPLCPPTTKQTLEIQNSLLRRNSIQEMRRNVPDRNNPQPKTMTRVAGEESLREIPASTLANTDGRYTAVSSQCDIFEHQDDRRKPSDASKGNEPESETQAIDRLLAALDLMTIGAPQPMTGDKQLMMSRPQPPSRLESSKPAPILAVSKTVDILFSVQNPAQTFSLGRPEMNTLTSFEGHQGGTTWEALSAINSVGVKQPDHRQVKFVQDSPKDSVPTKTIPESLERRAYASAPIRKYWRDYSNVRSRGSFDSVSLASSKLEAKSRISASEDTLNDDLPLVSERDPLRRERENRGAPMSEREINAPEHSFSGERRLVALKQDTTLDPTAFVATSISEAKGVGLSGAAMTHGGIGGKPTSRTRHEYRHETYTDSWESTSASCEKPKDTKTRIPQHSTRDSGIHQEYQRRVQPTKSRNQGAGLSKEKEPAPKRRPVPPPPPPPLLANGSRYGAQAGTTHESEHPNRAPLIMQRTTSLNSHIRSQGQLHGETVFVNGNYSFPPQAGSTCFDEGMLRSLKGLDPPGVNIGDNLSRSPYHILPQHQSAASTPVIHNTEGNLNFQPGDSFDSDNAIVDDIVELCSTTSSGNSDNGRAMEYTTLRRSCSIDSTLAVQTQVMPILPPRALDKEAESAFTTTKDSFDSMNFVNPPHEEPVSRTMPADPARNRPLPSPSVYNRQLSSPLRDSLIHAMSPMLSADTDDDSSYASSQNKAQNEKASGGFASCFVFESIDLSKIQEKLEGLCNFNTAK